MNEHMVGGTVPIGVIGGSGLYRLFGESALQQPVVVDTPYGPPSSPVTVGVFGGRRVAFLPRHGRDHSVAPHLINARANVWALASLGVRALVSTAAVGSVNPGYPPGSLAIPDQLVDRTWGRRDTFYDEHLVRHLPFADPFCPTLRQVAVAAVADAIPVATVTVIQGPRFSSRAESKLYRAMGGDLVNMTLYPEVALAAELGVGLVALAFVADTDAEEPAGTQNAVSADLVFERLNQAEQRILEAVAAIVAAVPEHYRPRRLIDDDAVQQVLDMPVRP
ncbi:MAG: MTAP family purine nucleoside phosphorylase [Leifsonia sp.]